MKPYNSLMNRQNDGREFQVKQWSRIGGWGITPDILELTGFFTPEQVRTMKTSGIDTSQSIEQIFGGTLRFKAPGTTKTKEKLEKVLFALDRILQMKKTAKYYMDLIDSILHEKWHDDDMSFIPEDLPEEFKEMVRMDVTYPYTPDDVKTFMQIRQSFVTWFKNPGYYSAIYATANTIFRGMILEVVSMALDSLSPRDNMVQTIDLSNDAQTIVDTAMEGTWR